MTTYTNLTVEDVAAQHQALTGLMLSAICRGDPDLKEICAAAIDKMIASFQEEGLDTTIFQLAAKGLRTQQAEE